MGTYDSFYDEDSTCPKCKTKVRRGEWQTKRLDSLFERWKKGDFLQYRRWEYIPEQERREKYEDRKFAPIIRITDEFQSDTPRLSNGKVPVYTNCEGCKAWLEAYAKITDGHFVGIVEAKANGEEKELIMVRPETTAKTLREEFERRLSHLQESCKHEKTKWMDLQWAPAHFLGMGLVCIKCEKILKTKDDTIDPKDPIFRNIEKSSKPGKKTRRSVNHDKILYGKS